MHGLKIWEDLELHAHDLAQINNDSIWMDNLIMLMKKFLPNMSLIAQKLNIRILDVNFT